MRRMLAAEARLAKDTHTAHCSFISPFSSRVIAVGVRVSLSLSVLEVAARLIKLILHCMSEGVRVWVSSIYILHRRIYMRLLLEKYDSTHAYCIDGLKRERERAHAWRRTRKLQLLHMRPAYCPHLYRRRYSAACSQPIGSLSPLFICFALTSIMRDDVERETT